MILSPLRFARQYIASRQLGLLPLRESISDGKANSRVLLVPRNAGSVEHYYHFIMGYFMPVVLLVREQPSLAISVRDCGPMNSWWALLSRRIDVNVVLPGTMLQRLVLGSQQAILLDPLDDMKEFDAMNFQYFRQFVHAELLGLPTRVDVPRQWTLLDRRVSPKFYRTPSAERPFSGPERRSVPNMSKLHRRLSRLVPVERLDGADVSPETEINCLTNTRVLIGQYGAGLTNVVWMEPGGTVLIINPGGAIDDLTARLMSVTQQECIVIPQSGPHARIDPEAIIEPLRKLLG